MLLWESNYKTKVKQNVQYFSYTFLYVKPFMRLCVVLCTFKIKTSNCNTKSIQKLACLSKIFIIHPSIKDSQQWKYNDHYTWYGENSNIKNWVQLFWAFDSIFVCYVHSAVELKINALVDQSLSLFLTSSASCFLILFDMNTLEPHTTCVFRVHFYPEDRSSSFLQNVSYQLPDNMVS